jgi:hypothetical protein
MNSDFVPFMPAPKVASPRPRLRTAGAMAGSISEGEFQSVLEDDEFQRTLVELSTAFYGDYGRVLDADSVAGLRRFLKRSQMRVRPTVGAESTGRLIATWRAGDEALSLEFISRFDLRYAVTANENGNLRRSWGVGHSVTLFDAEPLTARFAVA